MPELPEVETTCRGISPHLVNNTVTKAIIRESRLRFPVPKNLSAAITKQKVVSITRRAKYILINLEKGTIIVHLGMSGRLAIIDSKTDANTLPEKHDHVDLCFSNGKVLRYTDPRRFGCVLWTEKNPMEHKLLAKLGPEPLENNFTADYLFTVAKNKKLPLKQLIMNANIVVGVGNIYANEALFKAGLHPKNSANKINLAHFKTLVSEIKKVLTKAIKKGGTTLKDFLAVDGKPGYFSQSLLVYGRGGEPCFTCNNALEEERIGQRTTVFCSNCQPII